MQHNDLVTWKRFGGSNEVGGGAFLEYLHNDGNLLRFTYSSRNNNVHVQVIGYSEPIMTDLKRIGKWDSFYWKVQSGSGCKHDAVCYTFFKDTIEQLYQSLNIIDKEKPLGDLKNDIFNFFATHLSVASMQPLKANFFFQQPNDKDQEIAELKKVIANQARMIANLSYALEESRSSAALNAADNYRNYHQH